MTTDPQHPQHPHDPLAGAADVRARGDRRTRRRRAVLAGATAAVLLAGAGGGYALLSDGRAAPDVRTGADPAPSPAPSASRTAAPGTTAPTPRATPPPTTPAGTSAGTSAGIPASGSPRSGTDPRGATGLVLDVEDADRAEPGDWSFGGNADDGPVLDPCPGGTAYPAERRRTAEASTLLTSEREAGGTLVVQRVSRYPSSALAEDAAAGYLRAVRGCSRSTRRGTEVTYEVLRETTVGGAVTAYVRRGAAQPGTPPRAEHYAVQRRGDVVSVLLVAHQEDGDPGVDTVEPFAAEVARRLAR